MYVPSEASKGKIYIGVFHIIKQTDEDVKRLEELLNDEKAEVIKTESEFDRDGGYHVIIWYRKEVEDEDRTAVR